MINPCWSVPISMLAQSVSCFTPLAVVSMAQAQVDQADEDEERLHVGD